MANLVFWILTCFQCPFPCRTYSGGILVYCIPSNILCKLLISPKLEIRSTAPHAVFLIYCQLYFLAAHIHVSGNIGLLYCSNCHNTLTMHNSLRPKNPNHCSWRSISHLLSTVFPCRTYSARNIGLSYCLQRLCRIHHSCTLCNSPKIQNNFPYAVFVNHCQMYFSASSIQVGKIDLS